MNGIVFTTGDNAYPSGTTQNFLDCYEPFWERHKARTRPTPGNHDYQTPNAAAYFDSAWVVLENMRQGAGDDAARIAFADRNVNAARLLMWVMWCVP